MKKYHFKANLIYFSIFLILCILFTSCVTFPIPEKEDDTLLIIVVEKDFSNGSGVPSKGMSYYELSFKNSDIKANIHSNSKYVFVEGLKPGKCETTTLLKKPEANVSFKSSPKPIEYKINFELKPGFLTIFPVKFINIITKINKGAYKDKWETDIKISESEKKKILNELKENETFSLWKNEYNIY